MRPDLPPGVDTSLPARVELTEAQYAELERHIIHALPLPVVSIPVPLDAEQRQRLTAELLEQMVQSAAPIPLER